MPPRAGPPSPESGRPEVGVRVSVRSRQRRVRVSAARLAALARAALWGSAPPPDVDLAARLGSALYTGATALVMYFVLAVGADAFQFQQATYRGWGVRT